MHEFYQNPPLLGNQYDDDRILKSYLSYKLPLDVFNEIHPDLQQMGERTITDIYQLGLAAEAQPPTHIPYDAWGRRIDKIEVSHAWKSLDKISAEEKMIAIGYERKHGEYSRIYQFAKLYLFHPSSAIYTCPLAMTDGAARTIEMYGNEYLKQNVLPRLISSEPDLFWTSGQWMTEKTGGSDVSGTSTIAKPDGNNFKLYGDKWFTSATTSQMAMTLARIEGAPSGSKGLSLFYLATRNEQGNLNGIRINRLKDKLGTKALPTAEVTLDGAMAMLVGKHGDGVKKISTLFNITRIYNACCAVGYMRRAIALARDYASKRHAFGHYLSEHVLHVETLSDLQIEFEAAFHVVFHTIELLGKVECHRATSSDNAILRLLTSLVKLYTAKQAIVVVSEAIEAFGGAGYIEDTHLPKLLRDTQVLSIWEGTTNILCLDVLRAIQKENVAEPFIESIKNRIDRLHLNDLQESIVIVRRAYEVLKQYLKQLELLNEQEQQVMARRLAYSLIQTYIASLLLEFAEDSFEKHNDPLPLITAKRWSTKNLTPLLNASESYRNDSRRLGLNI